MKLPWILPPIKWFYKCFTPNTPARKFKKRPPGYKYTDRVKFQLLIRTHLYEGEQCTINLWIDNVPIIDPNEVHQKLDWVDTYRICMTEYIEYTKSGYKPYYEKYIHDKDYAKFKQNMAHIKEELIATAMHPRRLMRHLELGGEIEDF
jgi:hypothetical protein